MNIQTITKKPVSVEAVKFEQNLTHRQIAELTAWCGGHSIMYARDRQSFMIATLEGHMEAVAGECWIIKGTQGEFYPCKNVIVQDVYGV